jgi:Ser/Thr protein kinase RdoA (MazF antagonist)
MHELINLLRHYPSDCQPARIEPLGAAGGMSGAQFWRLTVVRGSHDAAQHRLCLRRWPAEHPSPERLQFIHAVLVHAAQRGITFLPMPIHTRQGESFIHHAGHLWQLEPWMLGTADYERSPRVEKLRAAMTALAQFHVGVRDFAGLAAPGFVGGQNAIERHLARLHDLSLNGQQELSRAITDNIWPELAPLARQFVTAMPAAARTAIAKLQRLGNVRLPLRPCLRDIWHDHVLFTGDEVTGIVDFGAVDIDTPATDIARLLGSLVSDDSEGWKTGLAAYSAVCPLSPEESLAVCALDASGTVLAGCNWIRWIYIEQRQFENPMQVIDRFRRLLTRLTHIE